MQQGFNKTRYPIVRKIGEGSTATVYESTDAETGQTKAIRAFKKHKVMNENLYKVFNEVYRILSWNNF